MYVYVIMLLFSLLFILLAEKSNNNKAKKIWTLLSVVPFILVSALRYDVGTDYFYRYVPDYNKIANGGSVDNLEIGFKLLVNLCILITKDYQIIFVVTSVVIMTLFMYTIQRQSTNKALSVTIFLLGGFFFQSLNILRQYMAIAIVFFSYRYLLKDKYSVFIISVILAFFIHNASIVCLVMLLLKDKDVFNIKTILIVALTIFIFGTPLINLFKTVVQNTRFSVYIDSLYDRGEMRKLTILSNAIIYTFMYSLYIVRKKKSKITKEDIFYINMQGLTLICIMLSSKFYLFFRIAYYFMVYQIISIPYFIKTIKIEDIYIYYVKDFLKDKIIIKSEVLKKLPIILNVFIILYFSVILSYTNILNNDEEVLPYKTIINTERTDVIKNN